MHRSSQASGTDYIPLGDYADTLPKPYIHSYTNLKGERVAVSYKDYTHFLAHNYQFPDTAMENLVFAQNDISYLMNDWGTRPANEQYWIIPLSTRADGGAVATGTFSENTLLEGYLMDNDLVQYVSDDTIEVLQKGLDKIISWQGNAPVLWRGINAVTNWWFKVGAEGYKVFSRGAKIIGIAAGTV